MLLHRSDRSVERRGVDVQPLYVGVQVYARAYYIVRVRLCAWLVVDEGTAMCTRCCRYRCGILSKCNDVNVTRDQTAQNSRVAAS